MPKGENEGESLRSTIIGLRSMMTRFAAAALILSAAAAGAQTIAPANMSAVFTDMSDAGFSVEAVAPADQVTFYAVCKAVWFSEKKGVPQISFSNPDRTHPKQPNARSLPEGWSVVDASVYFGVRSPEGNPVVSVAEKAALCRQTWPWYH